MKLKMSDLKLLMTYLEKEKAELVEINPALVDVALSFEFKDSENRESKIRLFSSECSTSPELTKVMKLYTRVKEEKIGTKP